MSGPISLPPLADLAAEPAADSAGWPGLLLAADPTPDAPLPCFPLAALAVRGRLDGLTAHVEVTQTFVNTAARPADATYVFPLPDWLTVTRFRLETAGRAVEAELRERRAPRPVEDRGVRDSPSAAIFEEDRPPVFTVRAGAVMPGEQVTVRLALVGSLPCTDGEVEFRFPLTVSPRYLPAAAPPPDPGDPGATPLPWLGGAPDLSVVVDVYPAGLGVAGVRSSLPAVLEDGTGGVRRVTAAAAGVPDRDFVLRYRIGAEDVRAALQLLPDAPGEAEGTFALTVVAPPGAGGGRPRDVVFALDRSADMGGWKLVAARRAVAGLVEALGPRDRFAVLAFDHEVVTPPRFGGARLVAADGPHRGHAAEFLARLPARGGTRTRAGPSAWPPPCSPRPTRTGTGCWCWSPPAGSGTKTRFSGCGRGGRGARPLCLGVDRAAGGEFLRKLAGLADGACELADSADQLDAAADRLRLRLGPPALAGLTLAATGFEVVPDTVAPARLADLYPGGAVCVRGRYRGPPDAGGATLAATAADGRPWGLTVPARVTVNPALAPAWARGYVRQLEDRSVTRAADRPALRQRAVAASLRFGVLSRFTAFVAVERPAAPASVIMTTRGPGPDPPSSPSHRGRSPIARHEPNDEPIHGYALVDFLGRGQFGEVWKARDKVSGKLVAVKVIDLTFSPTALKDTRRLTVLENLNHPHLIPMIAARLKDTAGRELDLGQADRARQRGELKELAFAMGLGEKSLAVRLRELNPRHPAPGPPPRAAGGRTHPVHAGGGQGDRLPEPAGPRDGRRGRADRPLRDQAGRPADRGRRDPDRRRRVRPHPLPGRPDTRVTGSPSYSAPELTANRPGPGSDQYALAVTYYELRTGRLPFPPDAGIPEVILAHASGDLDFSAAVLSDEERYLLRRATARDPADRFESCEEFVEELVALPEIWSQLRAKRSARADEFVIAQEPPAPVADEGRETKTWTTDAAPPPDPEPARPAVPAGPSRPPFAPALPTTGTGSFLSDEFAVEDPRASAPEPADDPAAAGPRPDTSTVTFPPAPVAVEPAGPPAADPPPEPDAEILAIIRGQPQPDLPPPPAIAAPAPAADLPPEPDADILAIIRGWPRRPSRRPRRPSRRTSRPCPSGQRCPTAGSRPSQPRPTRRPTPPARRRRPGSAKPAAPPVEAPRAVPPAPPVPPPVLFGGRSIGMPVDPNDLLGKRYVAAEPDTIIRDIIKGSQGVVPNPPPRPAPPAVPAKPVPPPPAAEKAGGRRPKKPAEPLSGDQTAALNPEEIERVLAEAKKRINDRQQVAQPAAKPPPPPPAAPPPPPAAPPPPKPPTAVAKRSPPPPPPPPTTAATTAPEDSPSKPAWYREAIREQKQASRRQVAESQRSGMTSSHWKEPRQPLTWLWVLIGVLILGLAVAVGVYLGRG